MRLSFSPQAETDLEEIGDYIALDYPVRALSFVAELRDRSALIAKTPHAFPAREDLAEGLRMMVYHAYVVFYRVLDVEIRIERILHASRDLPALFDESGGSSGK